MNIQFNFHGSTRKAGLNKKEDDKIIVFLEDKELEKQFGSSLFFYVENHSVSFNTLNRSHSELYALNSSISNAIKEQCKELL